ncbi:hypothetical protein PENSPDRAFT_760003 [Peniophora sp. CONT]|nr:hypothetical protein PENSPDRAFT_760003 [Peniophora sp. CONT]
MYTSFRPMRSRWRSCFPMIIPAMSSLMYILSLAHWIISLWLLNQLTNEATHAKAPNYVTSLSPTRPVMYGSQVALSMLVAVNVALSDAVVLWRMCLVWERARPVVALGAGLIAATLGVNITSSVVIARRLLDPTPVTENNSDWALLFSYGTKYVGLAGAFMSLASNLCATVLVGVKAWLHRIQVCKYLRSDIVGKRRVSLVQSVMELLAESGVVYTAIWLLYCMSFFRKITKHDIFGPDYADIAEISAADHLATAIAQMTSIYPLMVFALVALDKIHHSQGPWTVRQDEWLGERDQAVTVTIEIDVERSMAENTGPMRPMVTSWGDDDDESASGETKSKQRTM